MARRERTHPGSVATYVVLEVQLLLQVRRGGHLHDFMIMEDVVSIVACGFCGVRVLRGEGFAE